MLRFQWGRSAGDTTFSSFSCKTVDLKAAGAELIAMVFLIFFGCGALAVSGADESSARLLVALAFGMAVLVMMYSIGHLSGGHINSSITFSLVLGGEVAWRQGIANVIAQFLGGLLGASLLCAIVPCEVDVSLRSLGSNYIGANYGTGNALVAEILGTFAVCFVFCETAVAPNATGNMNACIAMSFATFLAHILLLPIDGCSLNVSRSFGPAVISKIRNCEGYDDRGLKDLWLMLLGPFLGSSLGGILRRFARAKGAKKVVGEPEEQNSHPVSNLPSCK